MEVWEERARQRCWNVPWSFPWDESCPRPLTFSSTGRQTGLRALLLGASQGSLGSPEHRGPSHVLLSGPLQPGLAPHSPWLLPSLPPRPLTPQGHSPERCSACSQVLWTVCHIQGVSWVAPLSVLLTPDQPQPCWVPAVLPEPLWQRKLCHATYAGTLTRKDRRNCHRRGPLDTDFSGSPMHVHIHTHTQDCGCHMWRLEAWLIHKLFHALGNMAKTVLSSHFITY